LRICILAGAVFALLTPNVRALVTETIPTGPTVGETMPAFALKDQHGNQVSYSPEDGKGRALILFHRSASW